MSCAHCPVSCSRLDKNLTSGAHPGLKSTRAALPGISASMIGCPPIIYTTCKTILRVVLSTTKMSHAWRPGSFKGSQNNVPYEFADLPQSRSSDPNRPTGVNPATTNTHSRSQSHICILPAAYHLPREHLANQRHATTSHDMQQHHRRAGSTTGTAVPKTRGTMNGRGCRPAAEGEGGRRGRECGGNVARNTGRIILFQFMWLFLLYQIGEPHRAIGHFTNRIEPDRTPSSFRSSGPAYPALGERKHSGVVLGRSALHEALRRSKYLRSSTKTSPSGEGGRGWRRAGSGRVLSMVSYVS
ncbi:hypothetical protein DFH09DRAFT_1274355 [Mycena vulgaris]|nr:hypothetical protein DFH09DRAFT_1274355 [Mycena vulgaris]